MIIEIHQSDERGNIFRTGEELVVSFAGQAFVVPIGFESDGVSTPKFLWPVISPKVDPKTLRAAIAHDYIYRVQPAGWTREMADLMFLCLMLEDGVAPRKAFLAYRGVRLFGWIAWRENQELAELNKLGD